MSSSSTSSSNSKPVLKAKRGISGLQGPPQPLRLPTTAASSTAARPFKKPRVSDGGGRDVGGPGLVIIYERTPKAVHVRPDEFMAVVQRLTGHQQSGSHLQAVLPQQAETAAPLMPSPVEEEETATAPTNHVVLTLGKQEAPPLGNLPAVLPSPGTAPDGFLLSPGIFLFCPATMQAIHELIS